MISFRVLSNRVFQLGKFKDHVASENISKNAKLPSKAEYRKHIKICLLFAENYKLKEQTEQLAAFRLVYNTACRFFRHCL